MTTTEKAALAGQSVWPNDRVKDIAIEVLVARAVGHNDVANRLLEPLGRIDLRLLVAGLADAYLIQFVATRRDEVPS